MKQFTLVLLIVFSIFAKAQQFTQGSVFNYNVGDTIVTNYFVYSFGYNNPPPPTSYCDIYTKKTFSAANDSVFYEGIRITTNYTVYPTYTSSSKTETFSTIVTNLNSPVLNYTLTGISCQQEMTSKDSICGLPRARKYLSKKPNVACFEPPTKSHTWIEGIGFFYVDRSNNSYPFPGMGTATELSCFKKASSACGTIGNISTGLPLQVQGRNNRIFPNPLQGKTLQVECDNDSPLMIRDAMGRLVYQANLTTGKNTIDVELATGVYIAELRSPKGLVMVKLVKE